MSISRGANAQLYPTDPIERERLYLGSVKHTLAELLLARSLTLCIDEIEGLDREIRRTRATRNVVMARLARMEAGS